MALYLTFPKQFYVDSSGQPYPAAKLHTYRAGTTTNLATYTTAALGTPHANPVVADSNGIFPAIYVDPNSGYDLKVVLKDQADVPLYTEDNIPATQTAFTTGTFTGAVSLVDTLSVAGNEVRVVLTESDGGTNEKKWDVDIAGEVLKLRTRTDADGAGKDILTVTRGTGTAITSIAYGNATDNPTHTFNGTVTETAVLGNGSTCYDTVVGSQKSVGAVETGQFECTWSGFSAAPATTTIIYKRSGYHVTLMLPANNSGTSNATTYSFSGIPAGIRPTTYQYASVPRMQDNGSALTTPALAIVQSNGAVAFYKDASEAAWTGSGSKGTLGSASYAIPITYIIA